MKVGGINMDHDLKQRLVGAIVITALAAIFIPMLFDDPVDETGKIVSELTIPELPKIDNSMKLPKNVTDVINLPDPPAIKEMLSQQSLIPEKLRWFIQVGIFSQENNAIALQKKIRKQGFPVSIMTVNGEKGVLYRVRVGPELSKKRAETIKVKVDKLNNIKGILTSVDG